MTRPPFLRASILGAMLMLTACSGGQRVAYGPGRTDYPEPGPPGDPWRPYIRQAANRFSVPQQWIRAVMRQESGGQEYRYGQPIVSGAGAMGLMQLMPATYADMQAQNGLGSDPFEPHDNIMAGTAYIRLMYDRYGAPAFLAAYNAGPQRLDDYLNTGRSLPNETVDYVASIAPNLGTELAMSGPLATYADNSRNLAYVPPSAPVRLASWHGTVAARRQAGACWHDQDAAYDPEAPCQPAPVQPVVQAASYAPASYAPPAASNIGCGQDPDAAYDPSAPCRPASGWQAPAPPVVSAIAMPAPACPRTACACLCACLRQRLLRAAGVRRLVDPGRRLQLPRTGPFRDHDGATGRLCAACGGTQPGDADQPLRRRRIVSRPASPGSRGPARELPAPPLADTTSRAWWCRPAVDRPILRDRWPNRIVAASFSKQDRRAAWPKSSISPRTIRCPTDRRWW